MVLISSVSYYHQQHKCLLTFAVTTTKSVSVYQVQTLLTAAHDTIKPDFLKSDTEKAGDKTAGKADE